MRVRRNVRKGLFLCFAMLVFHHPHPRGFPSALKCKGLPGRLMQPDLLTPFTRTAQFDQETDAVSVRNAKNIANEVDRKRTNRISLLFASSIGFSPFPSPRQRRAILIPEIYLVFPINPCKGVISVVNGKKITISNCYDNVYEEQKCNSLSMVFVSRVRRQAVQGGGLGRVRTIPKGSSTFA
jgi:hypothetical protein